MKTHLSALSELSHPATVASVDIGRGNAKSWHQRCTCASVPTLSASHMSRCHRKRVPGVTISRIAVRRSRGSVPASIASYALSGHASRSGRWPPARRPYEHQRTSRRALTWHKSGRRDHRELFAPPAPGIRWDSAASHSRSANRMPRRCLLGNGLRRLLSDDSQVARERPDAGHGHPDGTSLRGPGYIDCDLRLTCFLLTLSWHPAPRSRSHAAAAEPAAIGPGCVLGHLAPATSREHLAGAVAGQQRA
jgi:hypothetical protein